MAVEAEEDQEAGEHQEEALPAAHGATEAAVGLLETPIASPTAPWAGACPLGTKL